MIGHMLQLKNLAVMHGWTPVTIKKPGCIISKSNVNPISFSDGPMITYPLVKNRCILLSLDKLITRAIFADIMTIDIYQQGGVQWTIHGTLWNIRMNAKTYIICVNPS